MDTIEKAMEFVTCGVYIIGTRHEDIKNLMTAAWVIPVTEKPHSIAIAVGNTHYTKELLIASRQCVISVLATDQIEIGKKCSRGSGRSRNRVEDVQASTDLNGIPYINDSVARLTCDVKDFYTYEDHTIFFCKVISADLGAGKPLIMDNYVFFGKRN
jgi:flavin reductase (DIM6/NTAB) family NADH-FMN oxidoreductase RutF